MATYAFDAEDADFILRPTPPNVDFRVHRVILAIASPPLGTMLSLPQPASGTTSGSIPVVDMSENASTLRILLRLIYPIADVPTVDDFNTIDELVNVFVAAFKYDLDGALARLRTILISPRWLESIPLRVYAIAMRWDLEDEARVASARTLRESLFDLPPLTDFVYTSGYAFQRLVALHRTRSLSAQAIVDGATVPMPNCRCANSFASWFPEWKIRAKEELGFRPTSEVIFTFKFLGDTWAAMKSDRHETCSTCQQYKLWSSPIATMFELLRTKIDSLQATI